MERRRSASQQQHGFTIVELLIATMVFSVVLVIVTFGILQITRVYYKGVTESNTENVARSVMDTIAQAIQFNGGAVTETPASVTAGSSYAFCVGSQQFSYRPGFELTDSAPQVDQTNHALAVQSVSGCSGLPAQNMGGASVLGRELLNAHMRISNLSVTQVGNSLYQIEVRIVYGDDVLLNGPTSDTAQCLNATAGTQFCSVSDLTTTVVKRVQ